MSGGIDRRLVIAGTAALTTNKGRASQVEEGPKVYQLRIYQLFDSNKADFHDRFRDHAMRIMAKYGFEIVSMWEARSESGPEFVYLLRWLNEGSMKERWANFMADEEWSRIKRETTSHSGQLVGYIQDRTLHQTLYYPSIC